MHEGISVCESMHNIHPTTECLYRAQSATRYIAHVRTLYLRVGTRSLVLSMAHIPSTWPQPCDIEWRTQSMSASIFGVLTATWRVAIFSCDHGDNELGLPSVYGSHSDLRAHVGASKRERGEGEDMAETVIHFST